LKSAKIRNILLLCWPFAASAVMLTVIQPPISFSPLAWVSLIPFVLACRPDAKTRSLALAAYIILLCYWLGNLYWIFPITIVGWAAFCLYTALLWPIAVLCLRFCRIKKIPLFLAVPVLFVGAERLQGLFLGGFFWRFLAHSQYANITLIQIADIFGAAGVSFLIAMVNGLVAELIIAAGRKKLFKASNFLKTAVVCAALVAAVFYGRWRIREADKFIETGPLVASLQSNVPQSVKRTFEASDRLFDGLMQKSKASAEGGADLIVWPETMVQATLSPGVLGLLDSSHSYRIFDKALREHSKDTAFVLVGAYGGEPGMQEGSTIHLARRYNSAFLYRPDGRQASERYHKIHLVPFGEVVPFRRKLPSLYNLLMKFTPYNYDYSLDAGSEYTVFEMTGAKNQEPQVYPVRNPTSEEHPAKGKISNGVYRFSVMICYEDTIPAIARRFAIDRQGQKRLHWLINISNDGWFVRFRNGKVFPSTELPQHTAVCVFRAVENRLAVLRSVNTGISCLIDTLGRVRNGYIKGTLPRNAMERTAVEGWFLDTVPIDKRATFFSNYGQWLDFCCALCLVLLIIVPALGWFVRT
jgi:apolipoprotein N-acyltransferase